MNQEPDCGKYCNKASGKCYSERRKGLVDCGWLHKCHLSWVFANERCCKHLRWLKDVWVKGNIQGNDMEL